MIKLFATDLDGTLLAKNHHADEKVNAMIHKVFDEGKYFVYATGRNVSRARPAEVDIPAYLICMNGALIVDRNDNILYKDTFDKEVLKELLETFPELDFDCIGLNRTYRRTSKIQWMEQHKKPFKPRHMNPNEKVDDNWFQEFMQDMLSHIVFDQSNEDILKQDICKINLHLRGMNIDRTLLNEFLEKHRDKIINAPCDEGLYEITNKGTDKGSAVAWLANYLGLKDEEVATYGDGGNDIPMLTRFEHSYSPCNGLDYVKEKANHIIGPHYEYSVTNHILETLKESQ